MTIAINQEHLTGHAGVDADHIEIVEIMNTFYAALGDRQSDACRQAYHALIQKIEEHFDYEEMVMSDFNYPNLTRHKLIHADTRMKLAEFWSLCRKDICNLENPACERLKELIQEVVYDDDDFARYLEAEGIQVFLKL